MNIKYSILLKYLHDECSEEELRMINAWLSESEENRKALFLGEVVFKAKKLKQYNDPLFLEKEKERLYKRIQSETAAKKRKVIVKRLLQYAAVILAIVEAWTTVWHRFRSGDSLQRAKSRKE